MLLHLDRYLFLVVDGGTPARKLLGRVLISWNGDFQVLPLGDKTPATTSRSAACAPRSPSDAQLPAYNTRRVSAPSSSPVTSPYHSALNFGLLPSPASGGISPQLQGSTYPCRSDFRQSVIHDPQIFVCLRLIFLLLIYI